jgi:hypothetical protein
MREVMKGIDYVLRTGSLSRALTFPAAVKSHERDK